MLEPVPWPGAEIRINFPYASPSGIDTDGYFKVFFTADQFEELKTKKARRNIYVPSYEKRGRSTARFIYPAAKLSVNKDDAFVVKIPNPAPKPDAE